jgi:hypothetical protein
VDSCKYVGLLGVNSGVKAEKVILLTSELVLSQMNSKQRLFPISLLICKNVVVERSLHKIIDKFEFKGTLTDSTHDKFSSLCHLNGKYKCLLIHTVIHPPNLGEIFYNV